MPKIAIPQLTDFESYREAYANLERLVARKAELDQIIFKVESTPVVNDTNLKALAMVKGATQADSERIAHVARTSQPASGHEIDRKKLGELYDERSTVSTAIPLQQKAIEELVSQLSFKVCGQLYEPYRECVRDVVAALKVLEGAANAERALRCGITDNGFRFAPPLTIMNVPGVFVGEQFSFLDRYIDEAKAANFLK